MTTIAPKVTRTIVKKKDPGSAVICCTSLLEILFRSVDALLLEANMSGGDLMCFSELGGKITQLYGERFLAAANIRLWDDCVLSDDQRGNWGNEYDHSVEITDNTYGFTSATDVNRSRSPNRFSDTEPLQSLWTLAGCWSTDNIFSFSWKRKEIGTKIERSNRNNRYVQCLRFFDVGDTDQTYHLNLIQISLAC